MSCFNALISAALTVGFLLAGCGQLPKPFKAEPGGGAESPLVALQDSVGVIVLPIEGAPPGVAGPLADIMAAELRRANVPATTNAIVESAYLLEGNARFVPAAGGRGTVLIDWRVTGRDGSVIEQLATRNRVAVADWQAAKRISMNAVSEAAVPRIADAMQTKFPTAVQTKRPTIAVVAVEGAPGDGNEALQKAFTAVLKNAGLPVASEPGNAVIQIFGKVDVSTQSAEHEKLDIEWILRESDGSEIGRMTQSNSVEKGRATARWGPLAYDVAFAMIDSIADVLQTIERSDDIRLGR